MITWACTLVFRDFIVSIWCHTIWAWLVSTSIICQRLYTYHKSCLNILIQPVVPRHIVFKKLIYITFVILDVLYSEDLIFVFYLILFYLCNCFIVSLWCRFPIITSHFLQQFYHGLHLYTIGSCPHYMLKYLILGKL